jgi:glycine/D-amino acid oxidase-like deaminating enzyme
MKTSAEVTIIGGGIIGCSIAYYLAKIIDGVVLLERKNVASESSGANYGMIWRQSRLPGYDLNTALRSLEIYPTLIRNVFDLDIEYRKKDGLTIFLTEMQREAARNYVKLKKSLGIPSRLLNADQTRQLEPALSKEVAGSILCPDEATLNPFYTTRAFARAAVKEGAVIYTNTEVTGIKTAGNSVTGVTTSSGEIKTKIIINAAGSWASEIGALVGLDIPVHPHRLQSIVTEQLPCLLDHTIQGARVAHSPEEAARTFQYVYDATEGQSDIYRKPPHEEWRESSLLYLRPTANSNIVLGTACDFAGFDRRTNYEALAMISAMAVKAVPALKNVKIIRSWSNFDPWTADGIPIVEESSIKGFIVCAGHGTGMSHAPATAEAIAAMLNGDSLNIELPKKRLKPKLEP